MLSWFDSGTVFAMTPIIVAEISTTTHKKQTQCIIIRRLSNIGILVALFSQYYTVYSLDC